MSRFADQPAREANIEAIVSYVESGVKDGPGLFGVELEHFIAHRDDTPVTYFDSPGVQSVLAALASEYASSDLTSDGKYLGLSRPLQNITLEPAAQFEVSGGPYQNLKEAHEDLAAFEKSLNEVLEPLDLQALTFGYRPKAKAQSLPLIPKSRYEYMNRYFEKIGPYGAYMMRGSASTQVSVDYFSIEDALNKLRVSYVLVPLLSLLTDNSPFFEGSVRPHQLVRTEIWRFCDPDRCGLISDVMRPDFSLRDYASYILDTPAIVAPDGKGHWIYSEDTFGTLYARTPMKSSDVEHAISMFFPDVRLKTFVEIRPADSLPVDYAIAYAALIVGLLYNENNLQALLDRFERVTGEDIEAAKTEAMALGYDAYAYGQSASDQINELIKLADDALAPEDRPYLEPLAKLAESKTTLATLYLETNS